MEKYYYKLEKQIREKELIDFWVIPDRVRFDPFNDSIDNIKNHLKKYASRYANRMIANVTLFFDKTKLANNGYVFRFKTVVFKIDKEGNIGKKRGDSWGFKINYKLEDLYNNKFKFTFMYKIIKLVADEVLDADYFNGTSYKNFLRKLDEQNLDIKNL